MDVFRPIQTLSEKSPLLFCSFNVSSNSFTYTNEAFREFFDVVDGTGASPGISKMVHPDDRKYVQGKFIDCLNGQIVNDVECRIVRGKNERWLKIYPFLTETSESTFITAHAEDISLQKAYVENLNRHNAKKNSILSILSHDLAGPIATIQNLAYLINKETVSYKNKQVEKYVEMVDELAKQAIKLIRTFMDREFLESQSVSLNLRRTELVQPIQEIVEEYIKPESGLDIALVFIANREKIYVSIDKDKFQQTINNLLSNAFKFTERGGEITVALEESEGSVIISVQDSGIGIPKKYHGELFDQFSKAGRTGLHGEISSGLGMSIIKTIVDWHNGKIWFRSSEGNGTTFYIQLPTIA